MVPSHQLIRTIPSVKDRRQDELLQPLMSEHILPKNAIMTFTALLLRTSLDICTKTVILIEISY